MKKPMSVLIAFVFAIVVAGCGPKEDAVDPGPVAQPNQSGNTPDGMESVGGGAEKAGAPDLSTSP